MTKKINTDEEFLETIVDYIEKMWDWGIPFEKLDGEDDVIAELENRICWVRAHFHAARIYQVEDEKKPPILKVVQRGGHSIGR